MMEAYQLTGEQYALLVKDLEKLDPVQVQALSDNFVLAWKTLSDEEGAFGGLPQLTPPNREALKKLSDWGAGGIPSPGATVMALITSMSAEQRRQNKDQMIQESMAVVKTMLDQAQEIRSKAATQLALGIISGVVTIAQGVTTLSMSGYGAQQATIQGVTNSLDGISKSIGSAGQAAGGFYDSTVKKMDADIEKMRSDIESLRSFNQAFSEIIQKALSSQEAIQQSMNQARTKILG
jgi:hypothetical protein